MGTLAGCSRAPTAVPLDSMSFPVVLITGTHASNALPSRADVIANTEGLSRMRVQTYSTLSDATLSDPPIVIDATATAYDMKDMKGDRSGLWMMANPTGLMPIDFTLFQRKQTGLEAARTIIAKSKYLGPDLDEERRTLRTERILRAKSMAEIIQIVDEIPESSPATADYGKQ